MAALLGVAVAGFVATAALLKQPLADKSVPRTSALPPVTPPLPLAAVIAALTAPDPISVTASVDTAAGGTVLAGNVGIILPPGALTGLGRNVEVAVAAGPSTAAINAGGPSQFSPNGTLVDIDVRDSAGKHITSFPQAVTVVFKPNGADLAMARGDFGLLTAAYVIDADSPASENPNSCPVNTLVMVPSTAIFTDARNQALSANLNFIGSVLAIVTNPVSYVQTVAPDAPLFSSFDPATSVAFGRKPQFSYLQVVEPQIGARLLVLDPNTGNYAYVNAADVGPVGPPPASPAR